jgi:putative redox protein
MSDDRDHTIATATVTSKEAPYGVRINTGGHALRADEPADHGGADTGPAPFGLLLSGLGACTAITLRMYAEHQGLPLAGVDVELAGVAEKTPVTRVVRAGTEIRTTTGAA